MVLNTYCTDSFSCPNGNCVGCLNGSIWCQDPRCQPNCPSKVCNITLYHDYNANIVIIIILICLIAILFIVWFVYGPSLFYQHNNHELANVIT